jgi:FKBP-type peptidyl-prolyl cis-trans isomerase
MGVTKTLLKEGNGPIPVKGQTVVIEYTGYLKDLSKPDHKGEQYVYPLMNLFLIVPAL